jgi:hypothetical protein
MSVAGSHPDSPAHYLVQEGGSFGAGRRVFSEDVYVTIKDMVRTVEGFVQFVSKRLLWLNILALVVIKFALPLGGAGLATISQSLSPIDTNTIVLQTNAARSAAAVPTLARSAKLDAAAEKKLQDMAARGYFAHISPDGSSPWDFIVRVGYSYRSAGENLAKGFADPVAVVDAWMHSASHRDNIINPSYREIGIAAGRVTVNGRSSIVVVQMFATPLPQAIKKPAPAKSASGVPTIQRISTEQKIAPVRMPTSVTAPVGSTTARIGKLLSSGLALYLTGLLALLLLSMAVIGHRPALRALAAHSALLALAALLPAAFASQMLIF